MPLEIVLGVNRMVDCEILSVWLYSLLVQNTCYALTNSFISHRLLRAIGCTIGGNQGNLSAPG